MDAFSYDRNDIHLRYDAARKLPDETIRLWCERLAAHLPDNKIKLIVDLGCGTGRFSGALAKFFNAEVCAVDPSTKMLEVARQRAPDPRVHFLEGRAEQIPLGTGAADLVFLSMVYHHIEDKAVAFGEFRRVLNHRGRLAIRTATRERLDRYLWLRFFPAGREIEGRRTPAAAELVETSRENGFRLEARATLTQLFAANLSEYCDKIGLRGLSSLQAIPDKEFEKGIAGLRAYCESQVAAEPVFEETDLFSY
jgi:ubiquinone/menaquinone biosynthesis C-methylase UbiE